MRQGQLALECVLSSCRRERRRHYLILSRGLHKTIGVHQGEYQHTNRQINIEGGDKCHLIHTLMTRT